MDISKLESGELQIHNRQLNIHKFISTVKEQFAIQTREKGLELELIVPENSEETIIRADAERLSQVFNNLVSNAIKFTSNGRIEIGYEPKGTKIEFYIRDTGIGISPEYHHKIFERFRQIETSATRKFGGNGLGLAISKNLVELMGGEIWVESEIGKGAKFCFTINQ
jgi:signal transduction histidine kinase